MRNFNYLNVNLNLGRTSKGVPGFFLFFRLFDLHYTKGVSWRVPQDWDIMPFFHRSHTHHHGEDGFDIGDATHGFRVPPYTAQYEAESTSYASRIWEESDSCYSTCHHPEECKDCASYEDHLTFSALAFSHSSSDPHSDPSSSSSPSNPTTSSTPPLASSFTHGILQGRFLQREEDDSLLSWYRSRLQHAQQRHTDALRVQTGYHAEMEIMQRELTAVKDRLMAVQIAYEDLAMARLEDHGYLPTFNGLGDSGAAGVGSSSARSELLSPSLASSAFEVMGGAAAAAEADADADARRDVPRVVREAKLSDLLDQEHGHYFFDDEDEFEALQQLHLMEDREGGVNRFWSSSRSGSFSDDSSDEHGLSSGSPELESDSSPSSISLPSSPSSSLENVFKISPSASSSTTSLLPASKVDQPPNTPSSSAHALGNGAPPLPPSPVSLSAPPAVLAASSALSPASASEYAHDIAQLSALMAQAHQYNYKGTEALKRIKALIKVAERLPKEERTPVQLYLLTHWKRKRRGSFASVNASSTAAAAATKTDDPSESASPSSSSASSFPPHGPLKPQLPLYRHPDVGSTEQLGAASIYSPEIYVDASGQGIGFVCDGRWLAWTFTPNHPAIPRDSTGRVVMSWAELVAVELGLLTYLGSPELLNSNLNSNPGSSPPSPSSSSPKSKQTSRTLLIRSDNEGVVNALHTHTWTTAYGLSGILARILSRARESGVKIQAKWVSTKANPADGPSRGVFFGKERMLGWGGELEVMLGEVRLEGVVRVVGD
ncbi:hypothetical protein CPB84DRAFT_650909 [Gymnopilus junonius]|uniref:Uncharacterized protein n=1 Tax=Gymnopilus junonius TaxID=109634 RepID=A0A9P5N902_GYMJU|nr:hypothetical protein CPB84DRAFT_650909 [Gymnopilus junonius]